MPATVSGRLHRIGAMLAELAPKPVADFAPLEAGPSTDAVLERIEAAGIVGMGGGGYPTARKIREAMAGHADWVIGNGMASEPGVSADADADARTQRGSRCRSRDRFPVHRRIADGTGGPAGPWHRVCYQRRSRLPGGRRKALGGTPHRAPSRDRRLSDRRWRPGAQRRNAVRHSRRRRAWAFVAPAHRERRDYRLLGGDRHTVCRASLATFRGQRIPRSRRTHRAPCGGRCHRGCNHL